MSGEGIELGVRGGDRARVSEEGIELGVRGEDRAR